MKWKYRIVKKASNEYYTIEIKGTGLSGIFGWNYLASELTLESARAACKNAINKDKLEIVKTEIIEIFEP